MPKLDARPKIDDRFDTLQNLALYHKLAGTALGVVTPPPFSYHAIKRLIDVDDDEDDPPAPVPSAAAADMAPFRSTGWMSLTDGDPDAAAAACASTAHAISCGAGGWPGAGARFKSS